MRTINPKGYGELAQAERDSVDAWLEFHDMKRRDVCLIEVNDDGGSVVTRYVVDGHGREVKGAGKYLTSVGTQPELGDHDG